MGKIIKENKMLDNFDSSKLMARISPRDKN